MSAVASRDPGRRSASSGAPIVLPDVVAFGLWITLVVLLTLIPAAFVTGGQQVMGALALLALTLGLLILQFGPIGSRDMAALLFLPLLLSATQNLYLGIAAPHAAPSYIQVVLVFNFVTAVVFCALTALSGVARRQPAIRTTGVVVGALALWCLMSLGIFGLNASSAVASLRNIFGPIVFFVMGVVAARSTNLPKLLRYTVALGVLVSIFGFIELAWGASFWKHFNLAELWPKKQLPINPVTGLPPNYYSSELIFGRQMRRMVSSFADPINLGTFLLCAGLCSWYLRRVWAAVILMVAMALAVSKGALLGLLIFAVVWARAYLSRPVYYVVLSLSVLVGTAFVVYSLTDSTQSLFAHIGGFTAAFKELPSHPLGYGLGRVGVLAGLYGGDSTTAVTESGVGLIVGQLGLPGLILMVWFGTVLARMVAAIPHRRERVLGVTLFWSVALNIAFNEVALSPNSSAIYFTLIGILASGAYARSTVDRRRFIPWVYG